LKGEIMDIISGILLIISFVIFFAIAINIDVDSKLAKLCPLCTIAGFALILSSSWFLKSSVRSRNIGYPVPVYLSWTSYAEENSIYRIECAFRSGTNNFAVLQEVILSPRTMERVPVPGEIRFWKLDEKLPATDGEYVVAVKTADGKMRFEKHPLTIMEKRVER